VASNRGNSWRHVRRCDRARTATVAHSARLDGLSHARARYIGRRDCCPRFDLFAAGPTGLVGDTAAGTCRNRFARQRQRPRNSLRQAAAHSCAVVWRRVGFRARPRATQSPRSGSAGHDVSRRLHRGGDSRPPERGLPGGEAGRVPAPIAKLRRLCLGVGQRFVRGAPHSAATAAMRLRCRGIFLMLVASRVLAQTPDPGLSRCPTNGLGLSVWSGDSASARDSGRALVRVDQREILDTVWRFDIAERRWSRPAFFATIGAGWSSALTATGMTTAPGSPGGRAWHACAGVSIGMREPTLVLRGARGQVHLRADVRALSGVTRASRDTTSQPRR